MSSSLCPSFEPAKGAPSDMPCGAISNRAPASLPLSCTHLGRSSSLARICVILPQTRPRALCGAGGQASIGSGRGRAPCVRLWHERPKDGDGQQSATANTQETRQSAVMVTGLGAAAFPAWNHFPLLVTLVVAAAPSTSTSHMLAQSGYGCATRALALLSSIRTSRTSPSRAAGDPVAGVVPERCSHGLLCAPML
jgi:hypothetical protein